MAGIRHHAYIAKKIVRLRRSGADHRLACAKNRNTVALAHAVTLTGDVIDNKGSSARPLPAPRMISK